MIPEEMIIQHLESLLSSSEPDASLHHLHIVAAGPDAVGPLGLVDESKLEAMICAIAPDETVDVVEFISRTIVAMAIDLSSKDKTVLFAGLSQEVWVVESPHWEEEAVRLHAAGKLHTHPNAVEVTIIYAACSDGRRWRGRRYLTGPKAGQTADVQLLAGQPAHNESQGVPVAPMIRKMVGIR
jgi:hypothetical protein